MGFQSSILLAYSIVVTLVAIIFISLFSTCGQETYNVACNEQKIVKLNILTLDDCSCLSFTIFELIVIGVLGLGFVMLLVRLILWFKGNYLQRKDWKRRQKDENKKLGTYYYQNWAG